MFWASVLPNRFPWFNILRHDDLATTVTPNCNKVAALLGVVGATLADFGTTNSNVAFFSSAKPNTSISVHTVSLDQPMPNVSDAPYIHICSELKSSVVKSHQLMVIYCLESDISYPQACLHDHDHTMLAYNSPKFAVMVAVDIIVDSLSQGAACLLVRSQENIEETMKSLSARNIDTKLLIDSKRLTLIPNTVCNEVHNYLLVFQ